MKQGVPDSGRPAADSKQAASEEVSAWLEALEAGRLTPPRDPHDPAPWDRYWRNHLQVGMLEQAFSDWMSSDSRLPARLTRRGARGGVPTSGGSLAFVTGNLMTPQVCPGPFDVVIERRTVQLFPEDQQTPAIERLVARLAERGTLLSHQHRGAWRPGDDLTHHAKSWVTSHGFVMWPDAGADQRESVPRLAYLTSSSG